MICVKREGIFLVPRYSRTYMEDHVSPTFCYSIIASTIDYILSINIQSTIFVLFMYINSREHIVFAIK